MKPAAIAYLQLIRLPNLFTAAADILAGWLLVGGQLGDLARWVPLCLASMSLYAAGTALNDWFDLETDRRERPGRPLPSGRVSARAAGLLGLEGLIFGVALAFAVGGSSTGIVAIALAACILAYDAGMKRTFLGPELMGACRALNLLLGMSQAAALGGPISWTAAAAYGAFVTGITWISRSETETGRTRGLFAGLTLQLLALLILAGTTLSHRRPSLSELGQPAIILTPSAGQADVDFMIRDPDWHPIPLEGLLVLGIVALVVALVGNRAIREPTPARFQAAVKAGIFSLVWIDVGLVAAARSPVEASAVAAFWVPAILLGRWLYST